MPKINIKSPSFSPWLLLNLEKSKKICLHGGIPPVRIGLTTFRNSHRSRIREMNKNENSGTVEFEKAKGRAFAELTDFIEDELASGIYLFKLNDLVKLLA